MVKPAVPISFEEFKFSVDEIEEFLRGGPPDERFQKPFPPKIYRLKSGEPIIVRPATKDEAPAMLQTLRQLIDPKYDKDFYHLVAVRTYSEILAWAQNRLKDGYVIVATNTEGELMGLVNHRFVNEEICISLHTIVFKRAERLGLFLYAAKIEHAFDVVGVNEWWATFESPFGFRMGFRLQHTTKPWPQVQHELGGARVYYITREQWNKSVKPYITSIGLMGERPVPEDMLKKTIPLKPTSKFEIEF
ncbi:MAG: N-acetyltransferase [Nitrososphaerota archaeon]|nr:N-acetyltransferase [Candidatus Geocrenenecus dongiae]